MFLNTIRSASGTHKKAKRVGRGIGSTLGKTCGRGHKGQKSRSGGFHKVGFEGGQMPLQRRLPKVGFVSLKKKYSSEVGLAQLESIDLDVIDIALLKALNLIPAFAKTVKVINNGQITRAITLGDGIKVTAGAKVCIEAAGGKVKV